MSKYRQQSTRPIWINIMNWAIITTKLRSFFNWPTGQEFNISSLGEYLKTSWLKILLFGLVVFGLIWLTKQLIGLIKDLFN
jgi:fatty-acid desaturase